MLEGPAAEGLVRQYSFSRVEVELNFQIRIGKDVMSFLPVAFKVLSDDKGDWGLGNVDIPRIDFYPDTLLSCSFRSDRGCP